MKHRFVLTVALSAVLLWCPAHGAPAGADDDTLDQAPLRTTPDSYFYVGADGFGGQHSVAQIFTAGLYGYLTRVRLYLENDPASPLTGPVQVSIQTATADGLPSGREVTSGTIAICGDTPASDCLPPAGSPGWVDVALTLAKVTERTRYALVLRADGSSGHLRWYDLVGPSAYSAGFMAGNDGSGWWAGAYDDMLFQTYVRTPVLDQSQTVADSVISVGKGFRAAQTFTAGITGELHAVSLLVVNHPYWPAAGPVTVSIYTADGGPPLAFPIASGTIPLSAIPPAYSPAWVDVPICCMNVVTGAQYAIVLSMGDGDVQWGNYGGNAYLGGTEYSHHVSYGWDSWDPENLGHFRYDTAFRTYVLKPDMQMLPPPPPTITPCVSGVCPETKGGLTPADRTDGITSHFLFKERPNGTIQGVLDFTDAMSDEPPLSGCTTESAACRLTVRTLACTGPHEMRVSGGYQRLGDPYTGSYELTVSGARNGPGTFTLKLGGLTYTLSRDAIVEATCPAGVTR